MPWAALASTEQARQHTAEKYVIAMMKKLGNSRFAATIFLSLLFIASTILLYGRGIDNHFVADDWPFLLRVSKVHTLSEASAFLTFSTNWFVRPTQWLATWAIYQFAALNPLPYHLISILLECACALLLGFFAYRLLKA